MNPIASESKAIELVERRAMLPRDPAVQELFALLRAKFGVPATAKWVEVRIAHDEAVTVRGEWLAQHEDPVQ